MMGFLFARPQAIKDTSERVTQKLPEAHLVVKPRKEGIPLPMRLFSITAEATWSSMYEPWMQKNF